MEWRKTSNHLIGATVKKDIFNQNGKIILKKDKVLNEQLVEYLLHQGIEKTYVSIVELEIETELQIEGFIQRSSQPLFWESYLSLIRDIKVFFILLKKQYYENEEITKVKERLFEAIKLLQNKEEFFEYIYTFKGFEDSLYRHVSNVAIISYILSPHLNEKPTLLAEMGLFHDVGKSILNNTILDKPSKLNETEKKYIESHTNIGVDLLKKLKYDSKEILQSALLHHEYRNGTGYPKGYTGEDIPFQVQIITVVDTFDSICSDRVYKEGKSFFHSLKELLEEVKYGKLNPLIVYTFVELFLTIFKNKKIQLNNGQIGEIYFINSSDILRPIVQLDTNKIINLSLDDSLYIENFI